MNRIPTSTFRTFGALYIFIISIVVTAICSRLSIHSGMVLVVIAIATSLLLGYRMRMSSGTGRLIDLAILLLVLLLGLIFLVTSSSRAELWLATCYGIFDLLLVFELLFMTNRR